MACRPLLTLKGLFVQPVSSNIKYKQCRERSMNFCINLHRLLETKLSPVFHERGEYFHVILIDAVSCLASANNEPLWTWIVFKQLNQRLAMTCNSKLQKDQSNVIKVEVRPWKKLVPHIVSYDNAYRPRKGEEERIPHSFLFRRRDCVLTAWNLKHIILPQPIKIKGS